jgi:thiol-disulfide isomerase/thioredoxin
MLKSTVFALALGAAAAIGLFAGRKPLQESIVREMVLIKDYPTEDTFDEVMDNAWSPPEMLKSLWEVGKIPHRHYAINYLFANAGFCHAHWLDFRPMALESIASGDIDLQQPALAILGREEPDRARAVAMKLTADIDPEIRLLGLRGLEDFRDPQSLETYVNCLADRDNNVVVFADLALRRTTDQQVDIDYKNPASVKAAALEWRRRVNAPAPTAAMSAAPAPSVPVADLAALPSPSPMPAVDFALEDLSGVPFKLSDFRGKPVLLNFWGTGCGPCIAEMPSLSLFQSRHPEVQVLGICIDVVPDDDGGSKPQPDPTPKVRAIVQKQGVVYRTAVDPLGGAVGPYDGSGVPLNIFITPDGKVGRRFIGERSQEVLDRMLTEAGGK